MQTNLLYIQWTNNFGGLERITQDYESIFNDYNPGVVPLRNRNEGLSYKNKIVLKTNKNKILLYFEYFFFVNKNKNCIYHLQYPGARILFLTYLGGARKIIFHFHGTRFSANFFEKIIWKLLSKRTKVIANSNYTKNVVYSRLGIDNNITVVPNMIDTRKFDYSERNFSNKFIITYAGRFTKGKNIDIIIESADLLRDCDFVFNLYGEGEVKDLLIDKVEKKNLQNIVHFFPFTNEINEIYRRSSLFIFLSGYESFGNVVAEALLSGLPVLCNNLPSLREFIDDDSFFINELKPEVVAEKIISIKENYENVLSRTKNTAEKVREFLDQKNIIRIMSGIYKNFQDPYNKSTTVNVETV